MSEELKSGRAILAEIEQGLKNKFLPLSPAQKIQLIEDLMWRDVYDDDGIRIGRELTGLITGDEARKLLLDLSQSDPSSLRTGK